MVQPAETNSLKAALLPLERPVRSLATQASDALRDLILRKVLVPGQRLNEVELATALGISRAPLREGMQRLTSEGLLTMVGQRGAFVTTISPDDLRELYEVRIALETHAARLATERASAELLLELSTLLDETQAQLDGSDSGGYPEDLDFHERLVRMSGNGRLIDATVTVHQQMQLARLESGHVPERARDALFEHREVLQRALARDGDGAAALMQRHLESSLANALRLLDHPSPAPR